MVIKLDIVINNIMVKVAYFGKHISNKIREVNSNSIDDRTFEFMRIIYNKLNYNSNKVIIDFSDKDVKDVCVNKYIFDKSINYGKQ